MAARKPYKLKNVAIRMVSAPPLYSSEELHNPRDVVRLLSEELKQYDREVVCVVNFKSNMQPINMNIVSMGTVNASLVTPGEVFKSAILSNAAHIMLVHNHPSGRIIPSRQDDVITEQMKKASDIMGIPLLDHVIIGDGYYSYREQGRIIEEPGSEAPTSDRIEGIGDRIDRCQKKAAAINLQQEKEVVKKSCRGDAR